MQLSGQCECNQLVSSYGTEWSDARYFSTNGLVRKSDLLVEQGETNATVGLDANRAAYAGQYAPKVMKLHFYPFCTGVKIVAPDLLENSLTANNLSRMASKQCEQSEGGFLEDDDHSTTQNLTKLRA